jgi:hypothetical protein
VEEEERKEARGRGKIAAAGRVKGEAGSGRSGRNEENERERE